MGLKLVPVTPVPESVPPAGATVTGTAAPFEHKVASGVMVGTGIAVIVTDAVAVTAGHPPAAAMVYVTV